LAYNGSIILTEANVENVQRLPVARTSPITRTEWERYGLAWFVVNSDSRRMCPRTCVHKPPSSDVGIRAL